MSPRVDMSATVDALYAAASGQIGWNTALDHMLATMGFNRATVYAFDRQTRAVATDSFRLPITGYWHRHDASSQRDYEAEYYTQEPGRLYYLRHPGARIRHDLMFTSEAEIDRSAFYAWTQREADVRYQVVGQANLDQPVGASIALQRSRRQGPTTEAEVARFARLLDHLGRAIQVEHTMGKALGPGVATLDFLERNPTGIVILDGLGRTVLANQAARDMAAAADGFSLRPDGIAALRSVDDVKLRRLIGLAGQTATAQGLSSGGTLRLPRRSGRRDYVLIAAPLSRHESILSNLMPRVSVMITDPDAAAPPLADVLRKGYGISPVEARLAEHLIRGDTVEQAAQALRISIATARGYLVSIFRKTETHRQSELVRLLLSPPWWMLRDIEQPDDRQ